MASHPVYVALTARAEVAVDTGHSTVVPTITIEDFDEVHHGNGHASHEESPSPNGHVEHAEHALTEEHAVPGAMPSGPAPAIPDWYKVGWRAVSGIDTLVPLEGEEKDKSVLAAFLSEQYYGEWYHNAALIVSVSNLLLSSCTPTHQRRTGGRRDTLPYPLRLRLRLALRPARVLQHPL